MICGESGHRHQRGCRHATYIVAVYVAGGALDTRVSQGRSAWLTSTGQADSLK